MSKTFASVIALAAVAATFLSAHAGLQENGLTSNGLTGNGLVQNGLNENGISENGLAQNGLESNGLLANGLEQNGLTANGLEENGSGVTMGNCLPVPNCISNDIMTLQAVRLVMPDGTELAFH